MVNNSTSNTSPTFSWEYDLKDHLGNTRVVIKPGANPGYATVLQETNYFPFGMKISQLSTSPATDNRYLYNGKELQTDFGLNWYDYGARFYDPALGRWHSVDNKAEKYTAWSPYAYCLNNPIIFIDPDGNEVRVAKNIENTKSYKIFSATSMGKSLDTRFRTGGMKDHTLSISVASQGYFRASVVNSNNPKGISINEVTGNQLKGDFKFMFEVNVRTGQENSGEGAEVLGHEAFLHGVNKIDAIQNLIESGVSGDDLAKALNEIGLSSQIIYNGEVVRTENGGGGADHAKVVTGEDTELQEYIKQAKGATSNEKTKSEIQTKYDYDKTRYKNDAWIQWWINK